MFIFHFVYLGVELAKPFIVFLSREVNMGPKQTLKSRYFYFLWLLMFCNIIPITLLTSAYKIFGQKYINNDVFLSIIATLSSLFNCLGRIFWGFLVDKFSFKVPISCMLQ